MAKTTKKTTRRATTTANPTTTTKRTGVTKTRAAAVAGPTEEQIRSRAFEVYLRRNGAPGTPDGDWYIAEQELRQEMTGK